MIAGMTVEIYRTCSSENSQSLLGADTKVRRTHFQFCFPEGMPACRSRKPSLAASRRTRHAHRSRWQRKTVPREVSGVHGRLDTGIDRHQQELQPKRLQSRLTGETGLAKKNTALIPSSLSLKGDSCRASRANGVKVCHEDLP